MNCGNRLSRDFYLQDVLTVAPGLIGKKIVIISPEAIPVKFIITETEAYRGTEDMACHASKGRTPRTEIMFHEGGHLYIYLIYGMYWMLNVVTGETDIPQAVLIRGLENLSGPGKLARSLGIDRSFYGEDLTASQRIWIEDSGIDYEFTTSPRIGIDYSGEYWKSRPWRYFISVP
jgi:DNA-3-methyladenine glycosylase